MQSENHKAYQEYTQRCAGLTIRLLRLGRNKPADMQCFGFLEKKFKNADNNAARLYIIWLMDVALYVCRPYLFLRTSQVWDNESVPTKEKENETNTI